MTLRIIKILFAIFLTAESVQSQETVTNKQYETDEIIVEGYRVSTDILNAPGKIEIFTRETIRKCNGSRLSDIVNLSGNIYLKSYGGNSTLKTISLNGLGAEHTVILIDGVKLNSYQNSQADLSLISKDNIDRIEIINNGLGSIYGSEAVGGVINVVTRNIPSEKNTNIKVSGQYGSYGLKRYFTDVTKRIKNLTLSASLTHESSDDNFNFLFSDGNKKISEKRYNSNYSIYHFNINTNYKFNNSFLRFYSEYSDNRRNIPGIVTGSPDSKSTQQDNNWKNYLSYEMAINPAVTLKTILNYQNNLTRFETIPLIKSYYRNISLESSSQLIFNKISGLTIGYDMSYGSLKSNDLLNSPDRIQTGLFFVNIFKMLKDNSLLIYPSLRYDYYSDMKINNISAGIGLNYNLLGKNLIYFKSNVGNNFRVPSFNDLYWKTGGNRYLSQEKSLNFNIGFLLNYKLFFKSLFEFTYSLNHISDKIVWIPNVTGFWAPKNVGENNVNNINLELKTEKSFGDSFMYYSNITFNYCSNLNQATEMESDKQQIYVPKISIKVNTGIDISGFNLNIFYQYFSRRYTDPDNAYYLPSVRLFDGNFGYKIKFKMVELNLRFEVNNIFDEDYQFISGYPMPLRNYKIGFEFNY